MTWVVNRSAAYLADAAVLARAQWTQFSPSAMLAGLGLFIAALLLHLRCAWAVAAHTATHGATQGPADRVGASQAEATFFLLGGMEWAALGVTLTCAGAVFSANAIMAEGGLASCMVTLLAFALAMHSPPPPPKQLQLPWQLRSAPSQAASHAKSAAGIAGAKQRGALWCWGPATWSAAGLAVSAAMSAAAGIERRTLTNAMHKATASGAGGSFPWLAGLAARLRLQNHMQNLTSNPAFSAVLRASPAVAALMLLLRLQALFTAEYCQGESSRFLVGGALRAHGGKGRALCRARLRRVAPGPGRAHRCGAAVRARRLSAQTERPSDAGRAAAAHGVPASSAGRAPGLWPRAAAPAADVCILCSRAGAAGVLERPCLRARTASEAASRVPSSVKS